MALIVRTLYVLGELGDQSMTQKLWVPLTLHWTSSGSWFQVFVQPNSETHRKWAASPNLRICQVNMILLNIITAAYFISLIVMTFWTNIRPSYVNYWNKTEYLMNLKNQTKTEVDDIDVIMAANQVVIAVLGKFV